MTVTSTLFRVKTWEDYVTTVAPQLRIDHSDRLVTGSLTGTVTGEAYAKNPGLNYIAPSGALTMNLDGLMGQLDKRARLTVSDSFAFTPKPLAFIGPSTGSEVPDTFVRGIQTQRANSRTNVAMVTGGYQFTPVVALQGSYTIRYSASGPSTRRRILRLRHLLGQHFSVRIFKVIALALSYVNTTGCCKCELSGVSSRL